MGRREIKTLGRMRNPSQTVFDCLVRNTCSVPAVALFEQRDLQVVRVDSELFDSTRAERVAGCN